MKPEIVLRTLDKNDLPQVARVHIDAFPDSALTKLGPTVVEQYYLWQLTGPHKKVRATGAFVADECSGFSFSGIFNGSTSGFLHKNRLLLIRRVLKHPNLFVNSSFLKRLGEGVRLLARVSRKKPGSKLPERAKLKYGILSIAVSPHFQQLGIGQLLMHDAEKEALKYGYREICLTVHPANTKAVRFYERQNWQQFRTNELWNGAMTKILR
ncbi:MAG: GNAT family N-acetyltransferase [Acidobacteria bacterium]|nr:GNAT family N-acetyltransferase [Acidobacteriota bacterium]